MATHLANLAERVFNQPLMTTETKAEVIASVLAPRVGVDALVDLESIEGVQEPISAGLVGRPVYAGENFAGYNIEQSTAIISVAGSLVNRGAWVGARSGLTSYEGFLTALEAAINDPQVKSAVLDMNTPGGEAVGAMEAGARVRELSKIKPIVAFANGMAASAGYAIAAGATKIVAMPSSMVGSIGVIMVHYDQTERLKSQGVKPRVFRSNDLKAVGNPAESLTDDAAGEINSKILQLHDQFVSHVSTLRGVDEQAVNDTRSRTILGAEASETGFVDLIGDLTAAISLSQSLSASSGKGASFKTNKGYAMSDQDLADAQQAGEDAATARIGSIMGSANAKATPALAQAVALQTKLSLEQAEAVFAAAAIDMAAVEKPVVTPEPAVKPSAREQALEALSGNNVDAGDAGDEELEAADTTNGVDATDRLVANMKQRHNIKD